MTDFSQLPDVIEEATQVMGLGVVGGINSRAFSRDVLSVEITGPARPQLYVIHKSCQMYAKWWPEPLSIFRASSMRPTKRKRKPTRS
jgi:hypothetical protein